MSEHYEVYAVKYGTRANRTRGDSFIFDDHATDQHVIDYFVWVIRNENRTILVDTGYESNEAAARGRPVEFEPPAALAAIGIDPASIKTIIVSHLHYDHAGGLHQFENAHLHMQAAEMAHATGPCMCHDALNMPFTGWHVCEAVKKLYSGKLTFHDGDGQVAPGVTVHRIGGHSKGLQSVRVETAHGPMVLASDAAHFYENFEKGKPFPIVVDVETYLEGFKLLRGLVPDHQRIVPGHDPLVRSYYPQVYGDSGVDVRRLDLPRV
jgi:glyoxylase-like metal-dependent hydrolase (beta-lactamase superfamily II)